MLIFSKLFTILWIRCISHKWFLYYEKLYFNKSNDKADINLITLFKCLNFMILIFVVVSYFSCTPRITVTSILISTCLGISSNVQRYSLPDRHQVIWTVIKPACSFIRLQKLYYLKILSLFIINRRRKKHRYDVQCNIYQIIPPPIVIRDCS